MLPGKSLEGELHFDRKEEIVQRRSLTQAQRPLRGPQKRNGVLGCFLEDLALRRAAYGASYNFRSRAAARRSPVSAHALVRLCEKAAQLTKAHLRALTQASSEQSKR